MYLDILLHGMIRLLLQVLQAEITTGDQCAYTWYLAWWLDEQGWPPRQRWQLLPGWRLPEQIFKNY